MCLIMMRIWGGKIIVLNNIIELIIMNPILTTIALIVLVLIVGAWAGKVRRANQ